ncbi:MAG: hypothetical protein QM820_61970 [Minicystis sp.]
MHKQNLSDEQRAQVDFIEGIIRDRNASLAGPEAVNDYVGAAVSASLTSGPDGATLQGWITYSLTEKVYFELTKVTNQEGLPIAMTGGLPYFLTLRSALIAGKTGSFVATGWGPAGSLQIKVDGRKVFWIELAMGGAGLGTWRVEGEVRLR